MILLFARYLKTLLTFIAMPYDSRGMTHARDAAHFSDEKMHWEATSASGLR